MVDVNERIAESVAGVQRRAEKLAKQPALQRALVTGINANGTLELTLDDGTLVPELEALVQHVIEEGRELIVGMTGHAPEILNADLIAARTIIAEQLAVLFTLTVGQALESATFISGTDGIGFHIGDDFVEINTDVIIRGLLEMLEGRDILGDGDFDQDLGDWTASTGSVTYDAANGDGTPGAASHVTPASTAETFIESGYRAIDRSVPYKVRARAKPDSATGQYRAAFRYFDDANSFIAERSSPILSGPTVYSSLESYGEAPNTLQGESLYYPNADVLEQFVAPNPATANAYTRIDEGGVDTSDYIYSTLDGIPGFYSCSVTITTTSLDSKVPGTLKVRYWVERGAGDAGQQIIPALRIGTAVPYIKDAVAIAAVSPSSQEVEVTWDRNPATGNPWTESELEAFRSGGTNSVGFYISTDDTGQAAGMAKLEARVTWTSGQVPTKVKVRLYTKPPTAAARTTKWDSVTLRPQPTQHAGLVVADRIRMWGEIEPVFSMGSTLSDAIIGSSFAQVGSDKTIWAPAAADRRAVRVTVRSTSSAYWNALQSPQVVAPRIGISFDGGTTWTYGKNPKQEVPANADRLLAAQHFREGVPTGDVKCRLEVGVMAGYTTNVDITEASIGWTMVPANPM